MEQAQVIKIRPAEMELGVPSFQPTVVSSAANKFIQRVQAQSATENRFVFNWRSPASSLLCSPIAEVTFYIKIKCPYKLNRADHIGPLRGVFDTTIANSGVTTYSTAMPDASLVSNKMSGYRPLFAFGEGNCVMQACESKSITINGASFSELNSNLYTRSLDQCYVPAVEQQRNWSTCGGMENQEDSVCTSGHVLGIPDGVCLTSTNFAAGGDADVVPAAPPLGTGLVASRFSLLACKLSANDARNEVQTHGFRASEGATCDSGIQQRMQNFYDQIVDEPSSTVPGEDLVRKSYILEIKAPVDGAVFNGLWGAQGLSRSDPRARMALGLPHINAGQIVLQFKDLFKRLVRRYGRSNHFGAASLVASGTSQVGVDDVEITLETGAGYTPSLRLTYIRLPAWRSYPQSVALAITRREIRRAQGSRSQGSYGAKSFSGAIFGQPGTVMGLRCTSDIGSKVSQLAIRVPNKNMSESPLTGATVDVNWTGVQFPQPPSFLYIVYEKSPEFMNYGNTAKGLNSILRSAVGPATLVAKYGPVEAAIAGADSSELLPTNAEHLNLVGNCQVARSANATAHVQNTELLARNLALSQDTNAAILQVELIIQSAIGSFAFRDNDKNNCFLSDRDLLWRTHVRNCHSTYCAKGRATWQNKKSCLLLSSSDYLLGLATSSGTVMPITIDCKVKFANRAAFRDGLCYSAGGHVGRAEFEDFIVGEPIMVGIFTQNVLSLAASSGVYSSQAFSQATTAAALASS